MNVEHLAKLPPDAIAQVVNAYRDALDLKLNVPRDVARNRAAAAQAFRDALASVLPRLGDAPPEPSREELVTLETWFKSVTDGLRAGIRLIWTDEDAQAVARLFGLLGAASCAPDQERCTYCGEWYPKPVEYHHDQAECDRNRARAPGVPGGHERE